MRCLLVSIVSVFCFAFCNAQTTYALESISAESAFDNIYTKKIYSDSSVTSTIIWIKKEVSLHKHMHHTEQVLVIEGTALMRIENEWQQIKAGDLIIIPENTAHAVKVTSDVPLKVLSIQAPLFDGSDRILIDE